MTLKKTTIVRSKTSAGARKIAKARYPDWKVLSVLVNAPIVKEYRVALQERKK